MKPPAHETKTGFDIVEPEKQFLGMSYGDWITCWSNWLLSEKPDYQVGQGTLFLRGNIDYKYDEKGGRHKEPGGFLNRMDDMGIVISEGTPIFVPVITAMIVKGDRYEGTDLQNETNLRYAARKDIDEGSKMYAIYKRKAMHEPAFPSKWTAIVNDIKEFRFESPKFILNVTDESPLRERMEYPLIPGDYEAVTAGYFLIIRKLEPGYTYRIRIGGVGRGDYYTDAIYDITVDGMKRDLAVDVSGEANKELPPTSVKSSSKVIPDRKGTSLLGSEIIA